MTVLFNYTVGKVVEGADTSSDSFVDYSNNSLKLLPLSFERAAGSSKTCSRALAVNGLVCPTSVYCQLEDGTAQDVLHEIC